MVIKIEENIQKKHMRFLVIIKLITASSLLLSTSAICQKVPNQLYANDTLIFDSTSNLYCIQGIWSPINSGNEDLIEYSIVYKNKSISVAYTPELTFEGKSILYEGFYNLSEADGTFSFDESEDSLNVRHMDQNGEYYVWFFEEDVKQSGWGRVGGIQKYYSCYGNTIEMTDNNMTILEKQSFLPFTAINFIRQESKKDRRDYVSEFNIEPGKARVVAEKAYFHDQPDEGTRGKAFVVKDDTVYLDEVKDGWTKVVYEGKKINTAGWIKSSQLEHIN